MHNISLEEPVCLGVAIAAAQQFLFNKPYMSYPLDGKLSFWNRAVPALSKNKNYLGKVPLLNNKLWGVSVDSNRYSARLQPRSHRRTSCADRVSGCISTSLAPNR
jgi:hypothetical protein